MHGKAFGDPIGALITLPRPTNWIQGLAQEGKERKWRGDERQ